MRLRTRDLFLTMLPVLLVEPTLERSKIIEYGRSVHLIFTRQGLERFGPRAALAHLEHLLQLCPGLLVVVNRAAMKRPRVTGFAAQGAVELKLEYVSQKVTRVRHVCRHVIFRARVEIFFRA